MTGYWVTGNSQPKPLQNSRPAATHHKMKSAVVTVVLPPTRICISDQRPASVLKLINRNAPLVLNEISPGTRYAVTIQHKGLIAGERAVGVDQPDVRSRRPP